MKRHKILFLDEIGRIDGAEVVLYNLVRNIDKNRFETVVVCGSDGRLVNKLRSQNIQVHVLRMREARKLIFNATDRIRLFNPLSATLNTIDGIIYGIRFYFFLKKNPVDIVHTNTLLSNLFGSIPAKLAGKRLIWHEHNIQPPGFRRKVVNMMAKLFPDRLIVISKAVRDIYTSVAGGTKVITVYNGIDLTEFRPSEEKRGMRSTFNIPADFQVVAITAPLRPWKGQKYFLLAASEILKDYKKVRFLLVGDEIFGKDKGYKQYLKNLAYELGIENDVCFTGFRTDIPQILAMTDIFVSTSILPEPFSLIILEAMASGKPVVATRTGGVSEVVEDRVTGILVDPENAEQLSKAIRTLLENRQVAEQMGKAGRKRAEKFFSLQRFVSDIEKVYVDVLGSGGAH